VPEKAETFQQPCVELKLPVHSPHDHIIAYPKKFPVDFGFMDSNMPYAIHLNDGMGDSQEPRIAIVGYHKGVFRHMVPNGIITGKRKILSTVCDNNWWTQTNIHDLGPIVFEGPSESLTKVLKPLLRCEMKFDVNPSSTLCICDTHPPLTPYVAPFIVGAWIDYKQFINNGKFCYLETLVRECK